MKRGNTVWYNIIFCFIVMFLNYISAAINMFKWKRREEVVFDIIFCLIVNTVRKIAVAKAGWLTLSSSLRCSLQNYQTCIVPSAGVHTPESNLWSLNYRVRNLHIYILYWETCIDPHHWPDLLGTLDRDGNTDSDRSGGRDSWEKSSWGKLFHVISVGKRLIYCISVAQMVKYKIHTDVSSFFIFFNYPNPLS